MSDDAPVGNPSPDALPATVEISTTITLPILPLKNTVLYPTLFAPYTVGRPSSVAAVEAALANEEKTLLLVAQRDGDNEMPGPNDLYDVGTRAVIRKMNRSDDGLEVLVQGIERIRVDSIDMEGPLMRGTWHVMPLPADTGTEVEALARAVIDLATRAIELTQPQAPVNVGQMLASTPDPLRLAYLLGSMLSLEISKEQKLLEASTRLDALKLIHEYLSHEVLVLELRRKIANQAQSELTKEQREYILRQQLRAIQDELGEVSPEKTELDALRQRLQEADLPDEIRKEADRALARLDRIPSAAPEHQVTRTYLELILELPWRKSTTDILELPRARAILDEDHYGLEDVKNRIIEHLAILKLNPDAKAPILCFVGPPGVGKTSLGQSIARSLGRQFERMSLGGLHDEAELRGHRRTYIGAMPGRIIQAIRRAGVNNPLLMLDEVDKLGRDYRGDPASALLEILDPAQNHTFRDNYLDLPFDLSKVLFIATANSLETIPRPLLDRMELLRLTGYSNEEKFEIARRYLLPRSKNESGLSGDRVTLTDDALRHVISRYTREAGCRQLERTLYRLMRKVAVRFAEGNTEPFTIEPDRLAEMLGPEPITPEKMRHASPPGVATGLAWTETGGEVLYVEATLLPGSPRMRLTGQLGDVMRESAKAAQSYVWSHAADLGIDPKLIRKSGVHVHVPAGAVPKDGPSAGVALISALASVYVGKPVRSDTAMTGEITLSGLVLPIGGVKEKVLAARRAGIRRVVLPRDNEKDACELPDYVRQDMEIFYVDRVEELLAAVLPDLRRPPETSPS